jgi:hypothetical protein
LDESEAGSKLLWSLVLDEIKVLSSQLLWVEFWKRRDVLTSDEEDVLTEKDTPGIC